MTEKTIGVGDGCWSIVALSAVVPLVMGRWLWVTDSSVIDGERRPWVREKQNEMKKKEKEMKKKENKKERKWKKRRLGKTWVRGYLGLRWREKREG